MLADAGAQFTEVSGNRLRAGFTQASSEDPWTGRHPRFEPHAMWIWVSHKALHRSFVCKVGEPRAGEL